MDLRSLNIFIEVAELKSFTRAGDKLGYSQPTISFQIRQLEKELGTPLFDRIGHSVSLTDAGREVLAYAQRICQLSREMVQDVGKQQEPDGVVRLGMADSLCTPLILEEFGKFRRNYPKVSLQVITAGTGELFRLLDHNEVDMVCTLDDHIYDVSYVIADEEQIGVHFVAAAGNPLAEQRQVTMEELLNYPFLMTEKGMSYRRLLDEKLARNSIAIQPVLEFGGADQLCSLVEADMGVAFLPDYVTEKAVQAGTLVRLQVEDYQVTLWKQLLYRRDKWVSPQMRAMLSHLTQVNL